MDRIITLLICIGTLLSSGENASTVDADEARGSTGVDSRFDVFLDAAKELDKRGKSTAGEGGNFVSTGEDGMTEKERRRLEATRAKNRRVSVHLLANYFT